MTEDRLISGFRLFVPELYQQVSGDLLKDDPISLGKYVPPVAGDAFSFMRTRIFLASLASAGAFLKARGFYAPRYSAFAGASSEKSEESPEFLLGSIQ